MGATSSWRVAAARSRSSRSARVRASKKRDIDLRKFRWVADPVALAADPGDRRVRRADRRRRRSGQSARSRPRLPPASRSSPPTRRCWRGTVTSSPRSPSAIGVALNFEASVAGGIPIVKTLREGLNGNSFTRIYGILNGTCNYILSRMEQDRICLRRMPARGAAARLCRSRSDLRRRGPRHRAEAFDPGEPRFRHQGRSRLRSMSRASRRSRSPISMPRPSSATASSFSAWRCGPKPASSSACIRPWCRRNSAIAQVMGVTNAVTVDAEGLAPITLVGPGAGGMATASAVVSDLADIARGVRTPPFGRPAARMTAIRKAPMQRHEGGYYIRLLARDRPGSAATIARRLAQRQISLESIVQRHEPRAARRRPARPLRRAGAGHPHHLCDQRGRGPQGARRRAPRPCNLRAAAGDPDREELSARGRAE